MKSDSVQSGSTCQGMGKADPDLPVPFPESLCHKCAAPPRYIRTKTSVFIACPLLPEKYPPQPVLRCPLFRPRETNPGR